MPTKNAKTDVAQLNSVPLIMRSSDHKTVITYSDSHTETIDIGTLQYLDELCLKHGSDLEGRIRAYKRLTNTKQKPAVLISEITKELWFPLVSFTNEDCIWLSYQALIKVHSVGKNRTQLMFYPYYVTEVEYDVRVIRKQMKRAQEFLDLMENGY